MPQLNHDTIVVRVSLNLWHHIFIEAPSFVEAPSFGKALISEPNPLIFMRAGLVLTKLPVPTSEKELL